MDAEESVFLVAIEQNPEDETTRLVFADWLEERGDPRASWVRDPEIWEFMRPDASDPIPKLIAFLQRQDYQRNSPATLLPRVGPACVPALCDALQDQNACVRRSVAECLGDLGPGAAASVPALISALQDEYTAVQRSAASALGKIGPAASVSAPFLRAAVHHVDQGVREAAAEALGKINPSG